MDDIAGLVHKSPGYALLMLLFLLSLAGIPPTAGFLGKYYIFLSLIETQPLHAGGDCHALCGGGDLLLLPHRAQHVRARPHGTGAAFHQLRIARGVGRERRYDLRHQVSIPSLSCGWRQTSLLR